MIRSLRLRQAVLALTLAAALSAPAAVRAAGTGDPPDAGSPFGVAMAMLCGASIAITRIAPPVPIVVAVGAVSCFTMVVDALISPD